jgi:LysR family transcriptional activator of nhaA
VQTLNYKHLHYFWLIAKTGGVAKAGERLHLTPQSISSQIRVLEQSVGAPLLRRAGRRVELTDVGRMVYAHADRMFSIGEELQQALRQNPGGAGQRLNVGVVGAVVKSLAYRLLAPALRMPQPPRLHVEEGRLGTLLADLAVHRLDMVLSDGPMDASFNVRAYNHLLLESGVTFLATATLARRLDGAFPQCLDGAPMLLQGEHSALRQRLMRWLDTQHLSPQVVGDFDDTAVLKAFGQAGAGVFAMPTVVAAGVASQFGVVEVGRTDEVTEQVFAISGERRITHRAVAVISESAKAAAAGAAVGLSPWQ